MLSEWVIDPPENLEKDWVMVVCPTGKRMLVVAHKVSWFLPNQTGHILCICCIQ